MKVMMIMTNWREDTMTVTGTEIGDRSLVKATRCQP